MEPAGRPAPQNLEGRRCRVHPAAGVVKGLRDRLPKYMIPELLRQGPALPHLPNGKTDRVRVRREYEAEL